MRVATQAFSSKAFRPIKARRFCVRTYRTVKAKPRSPRAPELAAASHKPRVLDWENHDPAKQVDVKTVVTRIIALAQTLAEKQFYAYQVELAYRLVEALITHDGEVITGLLSRQSGKSECIASVVAACSIILPQLAKQFSDDWKFNITDDQGVYRGYKNGIRIGIYAPRLEQSEIMFTRIKHALTSDTGKQVLKELKLTFEESNGDRVRLSNGTVILCQSASEQSKIEGATHHFLVVEEAQDVSDLKVRKSLHPMVSSLLGTIVKIGTATTRKCDFYTSIKTNERIEAITGKRNHFFYPYTVTAQYNSLYRRYVEAEKARLGETSDEFRLAYGCEWVFERGMFITPPALFHTEVAKTDGLFSFIHPKGLPPEFSYYSQVVGIDWGASSDSTVVTTLAVNWNAPHESGITHDLDGARTFTHYKKHLTNWLEFVGDNYETQFSEIVQHLRSMPNLKKIVMDSNSCGRPLFDRFFATFAGSGVEVVPFNFTPRLKSDGYKGLYGDFCGQRVTFPASPDSRKTLHWRKFINQLLDLRKEYRNGLMVVNHPDEKGARDDYPDSLMMAAWGANAPAYQATFEVSPGNFLYSR